MRGVGDRQQSIDPLLDGLRRADDMKPIRDQRVFEFENVMRHLLNPARDVAVPCRLCLGEIDEGGLGLDQGNKLTLIVGLVRLQPAPTLERGLEIDQTAIQARMGDQAASDS